MFIPLMMDQKGPEQSIEDQMSIEFDAYVIAS